MGFQSQQCISSALLVYESRTFGFIHNKRLTVENKIFFLDGCYTAFSVYLMKFVSVLSFHCNDEDSDHMYLCIRTHSAHGRTVCQHVNVL